MNVRARMFEPMKQIPKKVKEVKKFAAAGGSDGGDRAEADRGRGRLSVPAHHAAAGEPGRELCRDRRGAAEQLPPPGGDPHQLRRGRRPRGRSPRPLRHPV